MKMKKLLNVLLAVIMVLACAACAAEEPAAPGPVEEEPAATRPADAPALPEGEITKEVLNIYLDGVPCSETGYAYADISAAMADVDVDGVYYYAATPAAITGADLAAVQGAFVETADGFVGYVENPAEMYLAALVAEDGAYTSVAYEGTEAYGSVVAGGNMVAGVIKVYLVTTAADFAVDIQVDGVSVGTLTRADFMKKTHLGEERVPTAFFDGSFLYDGGNSTYSGKFFGISYELLLAKLASLNIELPAEIAEAEFIGTPGGTNVPATKNTEYATAAGHDKYFGSVDLFCMYDGKTYNKDTTDQAIGLTAFINGTGSRWITYDLTAINFVTQ